MTTIPRKVALMAGWRHHESFRSVLLVICALVLAGACVTCVIDASALRLKPTGPGARMWVMARRHYPGAHRAVPGSQMSGQG
jgi:hypothetical protein